MHEGEAGAADYRVLPPEQHEALHSKSQRPRLTCSDIGAVLGIEAAFLLAAEAQAANRGRCASGG
jgi:hypothetical protein